MNMYSPQRYYPPINNGINWVQGLEGAKAWQLTPNSNVVLMDSDNDNIFYIKTSDNIGMCSLRKFRYAETDVDDKPTSIDLSEYVKKSELQELISSMVGGKKDEPTISTANGKSNLF